MGVDYWKLAPSEGLPQLPDQAYAYIVLDLGTGGSEGALEAFTGSRCPLLIASGADWRLEDTLHWLRRRGLTPRPEWQIGLPLAGEHTVALLASLLEPASVCSLPLQQDPFQSKGKLIQAIRAMFGPMKGGRFPAKHIGIFQKKLNSQVFFGCFFQKLGLISISEQGEVVLKCSDIYKLWTS
ncbi:hypothetical protein ACFSQ7_23105 [Paenibacillus rhizoplanae]